MVTLLQSNHNQYIDNAVMILFHRTMLFNSFWYSTKNPPFDTILPLKTTHFSIQFLKIFRGNLNRRFMACEKFLWWEDGSRVQIW